jgi:PDZ domain-containing protein
MLPNEKSCFGRGILLVYGALTIALALTRAPDLLGQDRDRESAGRSPREGGIPRRAAESDRDSQQQGTEEGLPDATTQARSQDASPRIAPPRGDWKLGVWVYNTDTGVVITRIERGSAADRRGLERGDRIVTVGGYQVGYVGDYLYPLGYELQRQAGRRGDVSLLVQDVRRNELSSFDVRLDGGGGRFRPFPADERSIDPVTPRRPSAPARPDR